MISYLYFLGNFIFLITLISHHFVLQAELDRFCDALISIREEIAEIENGKADTEKLWNLNINCLSKM
jgi:hypothetical protein